MDWNIVSEIICESIVSPKGYPIVVSIGISDNNGTMAQTIIDEVDNSDECLKYNTQNKCYKAFIKKILIKYPYINEDAINKLANLFSWSWR